MGLVLTEEQRMLRDAARELLSVEGGVPSLRELRDAKDPRGYSQTLWAKLVELGWAGITLPERYGGSAFGLQGLGVAFEECGRTLTPTPLLSTVVLGAGLIELLGSDTQREAHLGKVVTGETVLALAIEEQPRHQPTRLACRAESSGGGWCLDGEKRFVLDGHVADTLLVAARSSGAADDPGGISLFMVDAAAPGVSVERTWMVDSRNAANVTLDSVHLPQEALLGAAGGAGLALEQVLDRARALLAAEMLGGAQEAFDRTLAYLKMREQFGVVIGSFQALKHRAAEMFTELELARSAVYAALSALDDGAEDAAALASLAKAQAGYAYERVSSEAVQMHGGIGMTDDEEIGFFLKRARVAAQTFGDGVFHRDRYARLLGF